MSAWLPPFAAQPPTRAESGWTSLIELEKLNDELLILAGLHNNIIDFVKHRKVTKFRKAVIGRIIEMNYKTMSDYTVFPGGFYLIKDNILSVVE